MAYTTPLSRRAGVPDLPRGALFMRRARRIAGITGIASMLGLGGCSNPPPNPNPRADAPLVPAKLDLQRYMGRWYIIANIPYFAEKNMVGSYAQWTLRADGKITDEFFGYKKSFDAKPTHASFVDTVVPDSGNGLWKVRIFWPITVSQITLYVDPEYRYTILGYPGKKSLAWIFSRQADMDDATYQSLLAKLDGMGYDINQLKRVPQHPEQLGKPGFQTPEQ